MKAFIFASTYLATLLTAVTSHSQVRQEWVRRYNGPGNGIDIAFSLAMDRADHFFIAGNSPGETSGNDITTIEYTSSGQRQWVARYNGPGNGDDGTNGTNAIAVYASSWIYVAGWSLGASSTDYVILKYDALGARQWVRRYDGPAAGYDAPYGIALDRVGNIYVTGTSEGIGTGFDYTTMKYDPSGRQQWVQRYNGPGNSYDAGQALAVDELGNVYVTGYSTGSNGLGDCVTIKYDTDGNQRWLKTYDGGTHGTDYGNAIVLDAFGDVYVAGSTEGETTNGDYLTIKYDSSGRKQWGAKFTGSGSNKDDARSIGVDGAGNAYVAGVLAYSEGGSSDDWGVIKYDSAGVQQWARSYNGPAQIADEAFSIAVNAGGDSYIVGYSHGLTSGSDLTTVKYNTNGQRQWVQTYNGPANATDTGFDIILGDDGEIYSSGAAEGVGTSLDCTIVRYSEAQSPAPKHGR